MQAYRLAALSAIVLYASASSGPFVHDLEGRVVQPLATDIAVLLFTRTDCPVSNRYAPEVTRLHERFQAAGVHFWLVYVDPKQPVASVRAHIREYGYPFRAVLDPSHELVRFSGVKNTPEAAVYVRGKPVYRGRIDDRYVAPGKSRPRPTTHDLEQAIARATSGAPTLFRSTRAVGCFIEDLR